METQSANPLIPEGYEDLLESTALANVPMIRPPHGEPQNNPAWFGWDGEHMKYSQTKARQKYRNLQRDPHVALSVVDPENPYRYRKIRGEVDRIEDDPNLDFINSVAKKYLGMDRGTRTTSPMTSGSSSSCGLNTRPRWGRRRGCRGGGMEIL